MRGVAERVAEIKAELRPDADRISERYGGAPVIIVVAGSAEANVPRCVTVWSNLGHKREGRLRDVLGILQTAIQIEARTHLTR